MSDSPGAQMSGAEMSSTQMAAPKRTRSLDLVRKIFHDISCFFVHKNQNSVQILGERNCESFSMLVFGKFVIFMVNISMVKTDKKNVKTTNQFNS